MKMRLTLEVHYKDGTITEVEADDLLTHVAEFAAGEGLLSGDGPGEVEAWHPHVERIDKPRQQRRVEHHCDYCGREENAEHGPGTGYWYVPCPSDDCPSNDRQAGIALLNQTVERISKLVEQDPDGKKYPDLWALHSDISQYLDRVDQ